MQTKRLRVAKHPKQREFVVVIERDEDGWYAASVPTLNGCHTQARSLDELNKRVKEVILLCLDENVNQSKLATI
jgi:predicted RNase H-like HicB family nuclease